MDEDIVVDDAMDISEETGLMTVAQNLIRDREMLDALIPAPSAPSFPVMNGQFFIFPSLSHYGLSDHSPDSRTACTALQCAPSIPLITAPIYGYTRSRHSIALRRIGY